VAVKNGTAFEMKRGYERLPFPGKKRFSVHHLHQSSIPGDACQICACAARTRRPPKQLLANNICSFIAKFTASFPRIFD
jgi:hypothetical protein